ncbi:MAG: hypothetical protein ABIG66_03940 [Candidatus Kerfeldbacteria bacterium]
MEQPQLPFHHRHFPHFIKWGKAFGWKFAHLYLPFVIHYMTDKYEDRRHHVVIDTIYAVITFVLVAANIGLGVWYLNYFTPADLDVRVFTAAEVVSGEPTDVVVSYVNGGQVIENVKIDVYLPEGFVPAAQNNAPLHAELGTMDKGDTGRIDLSGVVFGSIGKSYEVRVLTTYTSIGREWHEVTEYTFIVVDSSLVVSVEFPETVAYGMPVQGVITYNNKSRISRKDTQFEFRLPSQFVLTSITHKKHELYYDAGSNSVSLPLIKGNSKGTILVNGYFRQVYGEDESGDQSIELGVSVTSGIESDLIETIEPFFEGQSGDSLAVVEPRVFLGMTGSSALDFGETGVYTVSVRNRGDWDMDNVQLVADVIGAAMVPSGATATLTSPSGTIYHSVPSAGSRITLPVISSLKKGEAATMTLRIPTQVVDGQQITSAVTVSGQAHSPDIDTNIPIASVSAETRFNSRTAFAGYTIYFGPNNEQIGYGPYPPQAWQTTALRAAFSLQNLNNRLENVTIRTTLPSQVEWTGFFSVTAGTTLHWDPAGRTVTWNIPGLEPQQSSYGAQFEVRFTPNHEQVGLQPWIVGQSTLTATDSFTGKGISRYLGPVVIPVAVVE